MSTSTRDTAELFDLSGKVVARALGLGLLEAWDVELPTPKTWAHVVDRFIASLEAPSS